MANEEAELHLFAFPLGTFIHQDDDVQATVSHVGKYWLQISGDKRQWLGQEVKPDINCVFSFEYLSFTLNHYTELLKFEDHKTVAPSQSGIMPALSEHAKEIKCQKSR